MRASLALALGLFVSPVATQDLVAQDLAAQDLAAQDKAAALASPAAPGAFSPVEEPDVWIFSGVLDGNNETYSGTLVSGRTDADFELKLADGATCDGNELKGDVGMVRLSEIPCTDGRSMRALFVPQDGTSLKVFGHVGDARFATSAHLLGTEPMPEKPQTMQPTTPQVMPPGAQP